MRPLRFLPLPKIPDLFSGKFPRNLFYRDVDLPGLSEGPKDRTETRSQKGRLFILLLSQTDTGILGSDTLTDRKNGKVSVETRTDIGVTW